MADPVPKATRVDNATIQREAQRFARVLDAAGVPADGVVAALLPNIPEFLYCLRGTTWSGRAWTPLNWHLRADDIDYILSNSEACALVVDARFADLASAVAARVPAQARFALGGPVPGFARLEAALAAQSDAPLEEPRAGTILMYTSGTTGRPKGVELSPPTLPEPPPLPARAGMGMLSMYLGEDAAGPHLVAGPLYHAAPPTYAEGAALLGADVIIMPRWDAEEFLRLVEEHRIVSSFLVPTHFVRLLKLPDSVRRRYDISSLRFICHGAAPVSPAVKRRMLDWFGPILFEFYGGTEGGGTSISAEDWLRHPGSVGKPLPGYAVHILDERGQPCPPGTPGDVYFESEQPGFRYKDDPEKTAAAYRGDLHTLGDIGYLDEEGYLYLCDRRADVIISGGVNIYPVQIESALMEHPEVQDCCVIGVPDEEWGERVVAVVQPRDPDANPEPLLVAWRSHCREHLADFQQPRHFCLAAALPRTEAGKLLRRQVRDHYREQAARGELP